MMRAECCFAVPPLVEAGLVLLARGGGGQQGTSVYSVESNGEMVVGSLSPRRQGPVALSLMLMTYLIAYALCLIRFYLVLGRVM